jgi:hypothetical protein
MISLCNCHSLNNLKMALMYSAFGNFYRHLWNKTLNLLGFDYFVIKLRFIYGLRVHNGATTRRMMIIKIATLIIATPSTMTLNIMTLRIGSLSIAAVQSIKTTRHNDIQHYNTQKCHTEHDETQHNDT